MNLYAVINGDWVDSSAYSQKEKQEYLKIVKILFSEINKIKQSGLINTFEITRLDSFQGVTERPEKSLIITLLLRSYLRAKLTRKFNPSYEGKIQRPFFKRVPDIRFAIGVGEAVLKAKFSESDGAAFTASGRLLEEMKGKKEKILITSPWKEVDEEFEVQFALLDALISRWTFFQSEVIFYKLSGNTEKEIAEILQISQPAVNFRTQTAHWWVIEKLLERFERVIIKNIS